MSKKMLVHIRGLSPAQARVLRAMPPNQPCDAWKFSAQIVTLYQLQAFGLISQGSHGWTDAELTDAGRDLRRQLLESRRYSEAAE